MYYSAYYLPNAVVGSITGFQIAYRLMLVWTVCLVLLAILWTFAAIARESVWIVLAVIFFSGMDVFGAALLGFNADPVDRAEWWAFKDVYVAYQSFTFQLFWAPHQVIASWILTAMLTCSVINRSARSTAFIGSLACFWSPFAAMVLVPLVVVSFLVRGWAAAIREACTVQNIFGGLILPSVFLAYYFSGSAGTNPSGWLWEQVQFKHASDFGRLILFYMLEMGILVALCWRHIRNMQSRVRALALTAIVLLVLMPAWHYGVWNDFLARGSVPCLWLLFFVTQTFLFSSEQTAGMRRRKIAVLIVLLIGALTPMVSFREALTHLGGPTRKAVSIPDYPYAQESLGSTDTFFFRHLSAERAGDTGKRLPPSE